ncbi:MAG: ribosomal protein S18-alanine N-acetyltransferase [Clostridia bacterium]|nr:ribosomal protein S18-alanine N-acetyltransferase [Clostridia bacterium]
MNVSRMTLQTAPAAAKLEGRLFSHPWKEEDFLASLRDESRAFFICTQGERLLGYCGFQWSKEQGDVLTIGVDPSFRRQGAGKALMSALLSHAQERGVKEVFLEVRAGNEAARRLYEQCGFTLLYTRKGYYSDPKEDGLVLRLEVLK